MTLKFTDMAATQQKKHAKCIQMHSGSPDASEVSSGKSSEPRPQVSKASVFDHSKKLIRSRPNRLTFVHLTSISP